MASGDKSYNFSRIYEIYLNCIYAQSTFAFAGPLDGTAIILGTFAIISNSAFLVTMAKHSSLRKTSLSVYLMALSVVDICQSVCYVVAFLQHLSNTMMGRYHISAHKYYTIHIFFCLFSMVFIIAINTNRYLAISRPTQRADSFRSWNTLYFAVAICTAAIGVTIYVTFGEILLSEKNVHECHWDLKTLVVQTRERTILSPGQTVLIFFIASMVTMATSLLLIVMTRKKLSHLPPVGHTRRPYCRKVQRNLLKMAVTNTLVSLVCISLADIYLLIVQYTAVQISSPITVMVSEVPYLIRSGINPIIYSIYGTHYRKAFLETFSVHRCKGRDHQQRSGKNKGVDVVATTTTL